MGPPPPPPPPPLQPSEAVLPSGGWKTTNAPRHINHSTSSPPKSTRPCVDSATLQHAAARLRKTGNNEQIRSDFAHLSDGRLAGENKRMPERNRQDSTQFYQLDINPPRKQAYYKKSIENDLGGLFVEFQIYASSPHSYHTDQISYVHRPTDPISGQETLATFNRPSIDNIPQNPHKTFTDSTSNFFISNQVNGNYNSRVGSDVPHICSSPYSSIVNETTTSQIINSPSYSNFSRTFSTPNTSSVYTSNYMRTITQTNSDHPKETIMQWTTPYTSSSQLTSTSPLDFCSSNTTITTTNKADSPVLMTTNHTSKTKAPSRISQNPFAKDLRDQGLTMTQRQANRYQTSHLRNDELPFDVHQIYQKSYSGDEVDRLVYKMQTDLHVGRGPASTTTTARPNICVSCRLEITVDNPGCTALDQVFHVSCFNCKRCKKVLAGASFYNIDSDPICENCYQDSLDKCTQCGRSISDRLLRACGGTFHVDCFTCIHCAKPLDGIPFTVDSENKVHCVPCFHEKYAPRCAVCGKGIVPVDGEKESVRVVAMEKSFHVDCYRCEDCGLQLSSKIEGQGCYPLDSHLYCKTCNSNRLRIMSSA